MGKTVSGVLAGRLAEPRPDEPRPDDDPRPNDEPPPNDESRPDDDPRPNDEPPPDEPPVPQTVQPTSPPAPDEEIPVQLAIEPDPVLVAAVHTARAAAVEVAGAHVGDHVGVEVEGEPDDGPVVTHSFATTDRAYAGWRWAVTLARAEGSEGVTVDEVVLLPGTGALLAPAWVPWSERVTSGDLAAGDLLPPASDDERLVPAYAEADVELADEMFWELGLGRARVLSLEGRVEAAERWWEGEAGPYAPVAKQAPGQCVDCGFLVPLSGALRRAFGVCANAYAPDDGRVVALAHGCGAHSETVVDGSHAAFAGMAVEDDEFDLSPVDATPVDATPVDATPVDATPANAAPADAFLAEDS